MNQDTLFIGLDVHKEKIAVAAAEGHRDGEVHFHGTIINKLDAVRRLVEKHAKRHERLQFCYEAGPCGYAIYRQITKLGHDCTVVAPSLTPTRPGDRVKTDRPSKGPRGRKTPANQGVRSRSRVVTQVVTTARRLPPEQGFHHR